MSKRITVLACLVTSSLLTLVTTAPAHAATGYENTDYVALGDSYSAGVGAPGQSGSCDVGTSGYPALWAAKYSPKSYVNAACGGAVTTDVINSQVSSLSADTDLVTITIGGNDVGFADVVITCTLASTAGCQSAVDDAREYAEDTLPALLDQTYAAIKSHGPNAEVVVLSYPLLFDETSSSCGVGGMSLAKRKIINDGDDELDDIIKAHAQSAGFTYGEARTKFAGHGVCASAPWINGLQIVSAGDSFHPNATGYKSGYLPTLETALG